ncbi:MAG TPA: hypothetical protein VFM19_00700 [Candidatus Limnocylindria bacterium]|nr:hypothetical protein [Candidatus Limnocylindria bacterium]
MNVFFVAFLACAALGAVLLGWALLARVGAVGEPGIAHRIAVAFVSGALIGLSITAFVAITPFLALLVGGAALLALQYRGEGRWPELAVLLVTLGGVVALMWGIVVVPLLVAGAPLPGGPIGPLLFGGGVVVVTLGIATLFLRPGPERD